MQRRAANWFHSQIQELAVPGRAGDQRAVRSRKRRVERLERADRGDVDPGDPVADRALAQVGGECLDLG